MGREREAPQKPQQQQEEVVSYTVEQLVAVNPYNPDILPDLENYVNEQVSLSLSILFLFSSFFTVFKEKKYLTGFFANIQSGCKSLPSSPLSGICLLSLVLLKFDLIILMFMLCCCYFCYFLLNCSSNQRE
jgi:hypothetical protein